MTDDFIDEYDEDPEQWHSVPSLEAAWEEIHANRAVELYIRIVDGLEMVMVR